MCKAVTVTTKSTTNFPESWTTAFFNQNVKYGIYQRKNLKVRLFFLHQVFLTVKYRIKI